MIAYDKLIAIQKSNNSKLCVGLDSDLAKIPNHFTKDIQGLVDFNSAVIEATKSLCSCYKINFAFYEQYGSDGFDAIEQTLQLIPKEIFTIADAKRGDIGNTSSAYACAVFENLDFDSITVNPYMGSDCVIPFLENPDKYVFLLALTSNQGSNDFQLLDVGGAKLYQKVIEVSSKWADEKHLGYVVGATHPEYVSGIRKIVPDRFLLFPGVGTQGGSAEDLLRANSVSSSKISPYLVNVSRDVIYPTKEADFAEKVQAKAEYYQSLFNEIDNSI